MNLYLLGINFDREKKKACICNCTKGDVLVQLIERDNLQVGMSLG